MNSTEGFHMNNSESVSTEENNINVEDVEEYRTDLPAQIEKHLEFVASNRDGHILLGSSNLTGRYWCGSVWHYLDPFLAPDIEGSKAALEFTNGVTDCVFINDKRAIVTQDGGLIDYITIKDWDGRLSIERTASIEDHGFSVVCVKMACNGNTAMTASMDMSIRLWDCHTTACTRTFSPAHTQEVTDLSPHPSHAELFLSSSLDGNVLLWDLRAPKPASCLFRDVDNCPSAVSWVPSDMSGSLNYVVGALDGELHLRSPKVIAYSLATAQPFGRPVFRIAPNKYRLNEVAACAYETKVQVFSVDEGQVKASYCDDRHTDFVRGLEWLNECCLMTCGWDKSVFHHSIPHQSWEN